MNDGSKAVALWRKFRRCLGCVYFQRQCGLDCEIGGLIRELVRQELAAEFERQRKVDDSIWAVCFSDRAAADPKKQHDRVMRLASARAAISILNERK
jgi:hypothetical protein